MHTFSFTEHAIGASDAAVSFDLQANPEGQEGNPEVEVQQVGLEEPEGEEVECPNHEPASFVKGKPRSILSLPLLLKVYLICYIYWCIKYRSCDETFAAFYSILVQILYPTLVVELGSSSSLAMLNR
jgi:hypothetical protein